MKSDDPLFFLEDGVHTYSVKTRLEPFFCGEPCARPLIFKLNQMSVAALQTGATVSDDLRLFIACFSKMAEKTPEGEKLRKKGFSLADPNGNGLVSLAEAEGFVQKTLLQAYPKDKSKKDDRGDPLEKGADLFDLFRPCYIRAFNDAKDYKADTGKVLEGTKTSTADDFVSKGEFRLLCAYLCIYGAMVRRLLVAPFVSVPDVPLPTT